MGLGDFFNGSKENAIPRMGAGQASELTTSEVVNFQAPSMDDPLKKVEDQSQLDYQLPNPYAPLAEKKPKPTGVFP